MSEPYLTANLPGIGGRIKDQPEDFRVEEIPLYKVDGVGEHCWFTIEKNGITTYQALNLLAKALGRRTVDFGYAGLKDARAITRQQISIEREPSDRIRSLTFANLRIVEVTRHRNKLKIGHLAGNRFRVRIRHDDWAKAGGSPEQALANARAVVAILQRTGVPNFFGPQRFGMRKDNHLLGLALLRGQSEAFLDRWLGDPDPEVDHGQVLLARRHYAGGRMDLAAAHWPGHLEQERRVLQMLARAPAQKDRAMRAVDLRLRRLLVCALQAYLFNAVLKRRLSQIANLMPGDLAWKHDNGAVFSVPSDPALLAAEEARCQAHEISPSGPMFGYRMSEPAGEPGEMEKAVLAANALTPENFHHPLAEKVKGGRRAMRFFPTDLTVSRSVDDRGTFIELAFSLPPGSFATVLLAEIMKTDVAVD
jgi:tRNA pseudouridine13 synthase